MLTGDEAKVDSLIQQLIQDIAGVNYTGNPNADISPKDGKVTLDEFVACIRQFGAKPFALRVTDANRQMMAAYGYNGGNSQTTASQELFKRLDQNGDGQLAADEFAITPAMRKLDLDDDENISTTELTPAASPYIIRGLA